MCRRAVVVLCRCGCLGGTKLGCIYLDRDNTCLILVLYITIMSFAQNILEAIEVQILSLILWVEKKMIA